MSGVVAGEPHKPHTGIPVLHAGSHFRHGLLQLMIHTIDPLHDGNLKLILLICVLSYQLTFSVTMLSVVK